MGARSQTPVLYKSKKCSQPLNHLPSPCQVNSWLPNMRNNMWYLSFCICWWAARLVPHATGLQVSVWCASIISLGYLPRNGMDYTTYLFSGLCCCCFGGGAWIARGQSVGISCLFDTWIQGIKLRSTALVANILAHSAIWMTFYFLLWQGPPCCRAEILKTHYSLEGMTLSSQPTN